MNTNLVKIDASEYGLEETKAQQIEAQFKPMLEKMSELEKEYNEVIKLEVSGETCAKAKELRLKYVKVRTGTAEIHKNQKAFYLAGGRFVDGWKNAQKFASEGIEDKLMAIEKHYENLEKEKAAKLQTERVEKLTKYDVEVIPENLGIMPIEVWDNYLSGTKLNYENRIAAEKKAEEDRIAREKAEADERERIRLENEKLKKEAEKREAQAKKLEVERKAAEELRIANEKKAEAARKLEEEKKNKEIEEKERIALAKYQAELTEKDRLEKIEREKREKLESELRS